MVFPSTVQPMPFEVPTSVKICVSVPSWSYLVVLQLGFYRFLRWTDRQSSPRFFPSFFKGNVMLPAKNRPAGSQPPSFILVILLSASFSCRGAERSLRLFRGSGLAEALAEVGLVGAGRRTISWDMVPMNWKFEHAVAQVERTPGSFSRRARAVTNFVSGYESTEYFIVSGSRLYKFSSTIGTSPYYGTRVCISAVSISTQ